MIAKKVTLKIAGNPMLNAATLNELPIHIQQFLPQLENLNYRQKFILINYLSDYEKNKPNVNESKTLELRKLGTLSHKASVSFSDNWTMTDEELLNN